MIHYSVYKFRSAFIYGGSIFLPEMIEIDDTYITLRKRANLFSSVKSFSIPLKNVKNIEIKKSGFGADIRIESISRASISCRGFRVSSALEMKKIILEFPALAYN